MTFKASKKREMKAREPIAKGHPLIPSVPIRIWYKKMLESVVGAMIADYKAKINGALENKSVKRLFSEDAAAESKMDKTMADLQKRWSEIFVGFAAATSKEFVDKSDEYATTSTMFSLKTMGVDQPISTYNEYIENTLAATQNFNNTLIVGIQEDVHEKIYTAVMLSLTSPNPEQQGISGIENALRMIGGFAENRVKLIARDQTSKLYTALSDERMLQNGIEEFEWRHSSAGKVPRQTHIDKDKQVFKINDPRLWTGPKSDQGPPGWAINCRCLKIPLIR